MKNVLLLFLAVLSIGPAFAASQSTEKARAAVLSGDLHAAITAYAAIGSGSQNAALSAEYGWVLTKAGYIDLGLAQIDRALQLDKTDADVLYYTSSVLASLGLAEATEEFSRPAPVWLLGNEKLSDDYFQNDLAGPFLKDINAGTGLLMQRRYASAVDRFHRMTKKYPSERQAWAGYAIALESIGAYKAAARAVAKDIKLSELSAPSVRPDAKTRDMLISHQKELEARPALETPTETPTQKKKANDFLKGRYLVFFGGSVNHTSTTTSDTIINLNARAGKFLTNQFDVGLNASLISGYSSSDYNGVSVGISARYLTPLPVTAPLSFTLGTRLQYTPGPTTDKTSIYLSPGLSYFLSDGSLDLTLDLGLAGPLKNTRTISVGYTMYLGGTK